jgi:ankyrin repeat protein
MRNFAWLLICVLVGALAMVGCRSDDSEGANGEGNGQSETVGKAAGPSDSPPVPLHSGNGKPNSARQGSLNGKPQPSSPDEGEPPEEKDPSSELRQAASEGNIASVQELLAEHPEWAGVAARDGRTPLHLAVMAGQKDTVSLLVGTSGVDLKAKDTDGNTPLTIGAIEGHAEIVAALLDAGSDIAEANAQGYTALHEAVSANQGDVMKLLIDRGADINKATPGGVTPLHAAVLGGNVEAARVLIASGANLNTPDGQGRTPLSIAETFGNVGLARLLKAAGAVKP